MVIFKKTGFTNEFVDANGDSLTKIKITSLPQEGGKLKLSGKAIEEKDQIDVNELEDITFDPELTWYGKTSFDWQGFDGTDYSNTATVYIEIETKEFCSTYWWLCYLIPACLTAIGVAASITMFGVKYYLKIRRHKAAVLGDTELNVIENPLAENTI